jgi:hypothetical protein
MYIMLIRDVYLIYTILPKYIRDQVMYIMLIRNTYLMSTVPS